MNGYLPTPTGVVNAMRHGRNPFEGYQRGWGLQYGSLKALVSADPLYRRASLLANNNSILSEDNRINLFLILRFFLKKLSRGHIIEFGSYRGGNAMFLAYLAKELFPGMNVYALDTFEGMPITDNNIDWHRTSDFNDVDYSRLLDIIDVNKLDNLILRKGLFEDTAETALRDAGAITLAHIDCDIYSSVLFSYQAVSKYMVQDGYIVFDDAATSTCIGATEVVEEHLIRKDGLHSEQIWPHFVFRSPLGSMARPSEQVNIAPMVNVPLIDGELIDSLERARIWSTRVNDIEASTSWRVTRPFRALKRAWRALSIE
jgi:Macrocin-O-methyltransferase (TylF)